MADLAPQRLQPMFHPHELLARRAGACAGDLRLLDLAPVVIVRRHDAAAFEQALQAFGAGAVSRASGRHFGGDPIGDFVAVGPVGTDRSGRPTPRPPNRVQSVGDPPLLVQEFTAAFVIRNAVDRRARIADAGDDQPRRPKMVMVRIAEWSSASSAWPTMSEPSNSWRVFARMRAQSSATLPLPMTAAWVPPSGGSTSANWGWPLYQPTNSAEPTTPGKSSPGMPSLRSCGAPTARIAAS